MTADRVRSGRPLWRDRRFATYWVGQATSQLGDRVAELAVPYLAVTILGAGPTAVGLLVAAVWAPNLVSLVVGAWVDRRPSKRRLLIVADLVQAAAILTIPLAHYFGAITFGQLIAVALMLGSGAVLYQSSYPTFFVSLVQRSQFVEANSLLSATRAGSYIVGPTVAGLLIQAVTAPVAVIVDGLSFLVSATLIGRVKVVEPVPDTDAQADRILRRAYDGLRFVLRHPYLRASLGCATTINFFTFLGGALVVLYATRDLHLNASTMGLAFGIGATGGLVGAALGSRLGRRIGMGNAIAVGALVFAAPYSLLAAATGPVWVRAGVLGVVEFVSGAGVMVFDINLNALQTAVIPDEMRGRVAGAFSTINYGIRPLGALAGGVLGTVIGIRPTMIIAAIGGCLAVLWLVGSPILRTRTIEDLEPVWA